MGMSRFTRRTATLTAWLAGMAMLFAALAPSIARATSARHDSVWTQICSASGTRLVKVSLAEAAAQGSPDDGGAPAAHGEHCPFCSTHAASFALPPDGGVSVPVIDNPQYFTFLFVPALRPPARWIKAQSRAPPVAV
jgi:hypothetical protein